MSTEAWQAIAAAIGALALLLEWLKSYRDTDQLGERVARLEAKVEALERST